MMLFGKKFFRVLEGLKKLSSTLSTSFILVILSIPISLHSQLFVLGIDYGLAQNHHNLQIDNSILRYTVEPSHIVGVTAEKDISGAFYGFLSIRQTYNGGTTINNLLCECELRFDVQNQTSVFAGVNYRFLKEKKLRPFVGMGLGYTMLEKNFTPGHLIENQIDTNHIIQVPDQLQLFGAYGMVELMTRLGVSYQFTERMTADVAFSTLFNFGPSSNNRILIHHQSSDHGLYQNWLTSSGVQYGGVFTLNYSIANND